MWNNQANPSLSDVFLWGKVYKRAGYLRYREETHLGPCSLLILSAYFGPNQWISTHSPPIRHSNCLRMKLVKNELKKCTRPEMVMDFLNQCTSLPVQWELWRPIIYRKSLEVDLSNVKALTRRWFVFLPSVFHFHQSRIHVVGKPNIGSGEQLDLQQNRLSSAVDNPNCSSR